MRASNDEIMPRNYNKEMTPRLGLDLPTPGQEESPPNTRSEGVRRKLNIIRDLSKKYKKKKKLSLN